MVPGKIRTDVRPSEWRRTGVSILGIVLVASLVAIAWWHPVSTGVAGGVAGIDVAMAHLVGQVDSHRFAAGRLSEPFAWGPAPAADRTEEHPLPASTRIAALELVGLASRTSGAYAARSLGVAYLVLGQIDKSINAFE